MKPDELAREDSRIWDMTRRMEGMVHDIVSEFDLEAECCKSSIGSIDGSGQPLNAARCKMCDEWVSAQNGRDIIAELAIGAEHESDYYCWAHLPAESDWLKSLPNLDEMGPELEQ